jgi:sarcosine oxidase, subunit beta
MIGRAVVIGGGLHGLSTALHAARGGWHVTLLERRHVGRHSSGVNAGGVRRLNRDPPEIALSMIAWEMWMRLPQIVGDDCGFQPTGQIRVAENDADMAALQARLDLVHRLGWSHEELIDRAETRRLLPAVAPHIVGALVVREDGAADPMRTVMAFRRAAVAAGIDLREGVAAHAIERRGGGFIVRTDAGEVQADRVANCAGAWAADFARALGDDIPCEAAPLMMIVTERVPRFVEPTVGATSKPLSFKQTEVGTVLIGGGLLGRADTATETSVLNFTNLARSAAVASSIFPLMRGVRMVRAWCGMEATTPDHLPVVGESPSCPGVIHSFGYSGHGFQLSPAAGAAVAELLMRGETNLPIAGLSPARFVQRVAA